MGQARRGVVDREVGGTQARAELLPGERHRHRRARSSPGGVRRHRRGSRGRCAGSRPGSCPRRFDLVIVATKRSGLSAAMASAMLLAKAFTAGQAAFGFSGATTCRPLPPEVLTKLGSPTAASRSRTSSAAAMTSGQLTASPGSRSMMIMSGCSRFGSEAPPRDGSPGRPPGPEPIRPSRSLIASSASSISLGSRASWMLRLRPCQACFWKKHWPECLAGSAPGQWPADDA